MFHQLGLTDRPFSHHKQYLEVLGRAETQEERYNRIKQDSEDLLEFLNIAQETYNKTLDETSTKESKTRDETIEKIKSITNAKVEGAKIDNEIKENNKQAEKALADYIINQELRKKQARKDSFNAAVDGLLALSDLTQTIFSREEEMVHRKYDTQLKAAEGNEKQMEKIERMRATEIAKIQRKEAIAKRLDTNFRLILESQRAIAQAIPNWVLAGILSGIYSTMTAALWATPLPEVPKFAKGTKDAPGGLAIVGEKGHELGILPSGQSFLTPNTPTLVDIPKHTEIIPNQIIQKDLAEIQNKRSIQKETIQTYDFDKIVKAIEKKIFSVLSGQDTLLLYFTLAFCLISFYEFLTH